MVALVGSHAWKVPDYRKVEPIVVDERSPAERATARVGQALLGRDFAPPPLPEIALALIELARRPEASFTDVLALLEQDPVLSARLLEAVQSSLYVRGRSPATLELALTRLGAVSLSHVFLQVVVTSTVFEATSRYTDALEALRKHSVLVGHATRLICRAAALDADQGFVAGLLHDIGYALGARLVEASAPDDPVPYAFVVEALSPIHAPVAAAVARAWRLPREVAEAIGYHHDPLASGTPHPFAAAIQLADAWASELGFPAPGEVTSLGLSTVPALELGARDLARLRASVDLYAGRLAPGGAPA